MSKPTRRAALRVFAGWRSQPWLSVAVLLLVIALRIVDPSTIERLRLAYFDFEQAAWPREPQDRRVVIVDIDQASLTAVGQWPWPRSTVAQLTSSIAAMQPAVIGFDVVLPLPDRLSPEEIIRALPSINEATRPRLLSLPPNDTLLADAFRKIPVVLGIAALPATAAIGNGSAETPVSVVAEAGADAGGYLPRSASLIANVAELDAAASGRGMVTLVPDDDGVLRRNPAAILVRDRIFPGLAVEMARVAAGATEITLVADNNGIESVLIGDTPLLTDPNGNLSLHYARPHALQILSAADILAGRISAASIRGKLVLLGTTALAISGYHATPLGDRRSGVEIHAQLLQNIRDGDVLVRPDYISVAEILLLLVAGVVFIGAGWRRRGWLLLPLF